MEEYPDTVKTEIEELIEEFSNTERTISPFYSTSLSTPGSAISLLMLLRIIRCAKGSTMSAYIHLKDIPMLLVKLLQQFHGTLSISYPKPDKINNEVNDRR